MLPESQALKKSRRELKILNLNILPLFMKSRNCRKSKRHLELFGRISPCCSMLQILSLTPFNQNENQPLFQEMNDGVFPSFISLVSIRIFYFFIHVSLICILSFHMGNGYKISHHLNNFLFYNIFSALFPELSIPHFLRIYVSC